MPAGCASAVLPAAVAASMFWKYFCLTKNDAAFQRVFQYCSVAEPCRLLVPDLVEKAMFSPMECPTEASKLVVSILNSAIWSVKGVNAIPPLPRFGAPSMLHSFWPRLSGAIKARRLRRPGPV